MRKEARSFGFNVIGNVSSNTGLGVVARNMIQALLQRGLAVSVLDLDPGLGRAGRCAFAGTRVDSPEELPYQVNFFVLQPTAIFALAASFPEVFVTAEALNVGLVMWELPTFPRSWLPALGVLDIVAAASDFIDATFSLSGAGRPTIAAACPIYLPEPIDGSRRRLGVPEEGVLFVTSFEPSSDIQRKNPFATIAAFRQAFSGDGRRHLIIKLNNALAHGRPHRAVTELHTLCDGQDNVHIVDKTLSYSEVLALYAACDVFVSLHRAEGLGLGIMEAMALGKPVIATGWSGNMTFMDHTNSCLVGFDLVPADGSLAVYRRPYVGREAIWADPRVEDAAAWMRQLADDGDLRASIGARARASIARYQELATEAHFVDELRAIWEQRTFVPSMTQRHRLRVRQLWEAAHAGSPPAAERFRRKLRRVAEEHLLWRFRS